MIGKSTMVLTVAMLMGGTGALRAGTAPPPLNARGQSGQVAMEDDTTTAGDKDLPLESGRTVSFTTNEGTWMSLDVSPDGETIVFDMLGDLYTMPVTGGRATQLTRGMAFDAQPRFSPDGSRVVYTSDHSGGENLWIISTDASDTSQLT